MWSTGACVTSPPPSGRWRCTAWLSAPPGAENLYPADAELNLPAGLHSHEVARLAALESARGSFHDAAEALTRACGAPVAAPQAVRAMAIGATADFAAFYDHTVPMTTDAGTLLVLTVDGTGIAVRPEDLREATRKKAERDAAAGRLGDDGHGGRKRMACVGAVYDAEPVVRRPHDIITLAKAGKTKHKKKTSKKNRAKRTGPKAMRKWLTASVADDPADVIKCVFDQAEVRDPEYRRTWIVLVDGATAQIDAIRAEAAKRNAPIHIVIDFIHVLPYLHQAARILHGDKAATVALQDAGEHALAVLPAGTTRSPTNSPPQRRRGPTPTATRRSARPSPTCGTNTTTCAMTPPWPPDGRLPPA